MFTLIIEDKHGAIVDEYSFEDGEFIIGRSQQADIVLPADNVSRRHARLFTVDGRCYIEDLKAANGIWLNGKRIYNVTELPRSAQVRIGDFFLHIEGAAYARPMGSAVYARLLPMPGSIGELTELSQPTVLIGRGKDCAVVLSDVSVSRIHAKITQQPDGRVTVEDLRSSNGTYVSDRRIDQQELQHGDRIRFGTVAFAYQVEGMPDVDIQDAPYVPQAPQPRAMPVARQPTHHYTGNQHGAQGSVHGGQGSGHGGPYANQGNQYGGYPAEQPVSVVEAVYAPQQRSILPQVAAVAVILVAVVGLIILVLFAFKFWVDPALRANANIADAKVDPAAAPAVKAAAPAAIPADPQALAKAQTDEMIAHGQDAIARRQWDEAERHLRRAWEVDSRKPGLAEALNKVNMEKKAGARFAQAEAAFAKKDYATAIRQHRMIPQNSAYRPDADAALDAIAQVLEMDGDTACASKDAAKCQESYSLALSTGFASATVEAKYAKVLKGGK